MTDEPIHCADEAGLLDRWRRLQMIVRCGLSIRPADYVHLYLHLGRRIARRGVRPPGVAQRDMLHTLLRTAQDSALPWPLRRVCLEQATPLLAQLKALVGLHQPQALRALEMEMQQAVEGAR